MISLTPNAVQKMKDLIHNQDPSSVGMRLAVIGSGCAGYEYKLGFTAGARTLDKVFTFDGLNIYVDGLSMSFVDGVTIDYQENMMSSNFVFDNPNAKRSCGCGNSFSV
jgi:iron-sulfur cluster assembly accessory protein